MARKFYYDNGSEKIGPVTGNELVRLRAAGQLPTDGDSVACRRF